MLEPHGDHQFPRADGDPRIERDLAPHRHGDRDPGVCGGQRPGRRRHGDAAVRAGDDEVNRAAHRGHDERPAGRLRESVRPNAPARCVTLTRSARPVGELSAPAFSTRSRRPSGGPASGGAPAGAGRSSPAASPAVPGRRRHSFRATAQPGAELVRIAEPGELGGGDGKGVRYGVGGLSRRVRIGQHGPAVGVERRCVTVIRLDEPARVTVDDGRDQLTVLHGPNRSSPPMAASRKDITR